MQPTHVQYQQLSQLVGREPSLGLFGKSICNEVDGLFDLVNGTRRNGVKPSRLATNYDCSDDENADRCGCDEKISDQMPMR
jgi:hypothetical protein